jgi:hypothetical protein
MTKPAGVHPISGCHRGLGGFPLITSSKAVNKMYPFSELESSLKKLMMKVC